MTVDRRQRKVVEDVEMSEMMASRYSGRSGEFTGLPEENDHEEGSMPEPKRNKKYNAVPAKCKVLRHDLRILVCLSFSC